jgi:hypothetical protein
VYESRVMFFLCNNPRVLSLSFKRSQKKNFLLGLTTRSPNPIKSRVDIGISNKMHVCLLNQEASITPNVEPYIILAIDLRRKQENLKLTKLFLGLFKW